MHDPRKPSPIMAARPCVRLRCPRPSPIAYRTQNGGDDEIPALALRAEIAPGTIGFAAHLRTA
jgi:hypothetical protein